MLRIKSFFLTFVLCFVAVIACAADAEPQTEQSAAALLSRQFSTMESIRGRFNQQIFDENGSVLQEASGELAVKRPRQFYWKTETPYQHLVIASGDTIWLYDMDLEQITRQPFSEKLDQAPALILSGEVDALAQQYAISVEKGAEAGQQSLTFTLSPHGESGVFKKLTLRFDTGKITSMTMEDSFQQRTEIAFSNLIYNAAIPASLFEFTPPPGIDVITNE